MKFPDLAQSRVGMPILFALQAVAALHASPTTTRRAAFNAASLTSISAPSAFAASPTDYASLADAAARAFQRADYAGSEKLWREATAIAPREAVAWSNLAVTLIINASEGGEMQLGVAPTGEARKRLEEALTAIDTAESLGSSPDALNLNAKGNALGLLLQWSDARAAYEASGDAADRSFASIPRSNEALALFELGSLPEAEKVARKLIRRDPNFKDGFALLAALRYAQGDTGGAAALVNDLCAGASGLCARYADVNIVLAVEPKGGRDVSQAADGAVNTARAEEWARVAFSQNILRVSAWRLLDARRFGPPLASSASSTASIGRFNRSSCASSVATSNASASSFFAFSSAASLACASARSCSCFHATRAAAASPKCSANK